MSINIRESIDTTPTLTDEGLGRRGAARRRYGPENSTRSFPTGLLISLGALAVILGIWYFSEN